MRLTAILAIAHDGALGLGGSLPWPRLPRDLRRFREATMGRVCLVGRRTYDTLPALKGRRLVMLSRGDTRPILTCAPASEGHGAWHAMTYVKPSIDAALSHATNEPEVMVIGGAEVYRLAWPHLTRILLTVVDGAHPADTYLDPPGVLTEGFTCLTSQRHDPDADNPLGLVFSEWVRRV